MPQGWTPVADTSAWKTVAEATPPQDSLTHDFLKYSPVGMVQGVAAALRDPKSAVTGMLKGNGAIWEKAKDSYGKGDYAGAAAHFLNYLMPGGSALDDAGEDFAKGEYAHGAAKTAGLATSMVTAAKAPAALDAAAETAPKVVAAVKAGAKAAAPDVLAGGAKAAAGTAVSEMLPGGPLKYVAGAAPVYSGVRQIGRGLTKGVAAGKEAFSLADRVAAASEAATADSANELLNGIAQGYKYKDFASAPAEAQQIIRNQADAVKRSQQVPAPKPSPASAAPAQAAPAPAGAPEAAPSAFTPAGPVRPPLEPSGLPTARGPIPDDATPQDLYKYPAPQVQAWLQAKRAAGPVRPPLAQAPAPAPAPAATAPSGTLAEQLRDEMLRTGSATPEQVVPPEVQPQTPAGQEAFRDMMREVTPQAGKAIANANYAGAPDSPTAGAVYEAAARADKATKLAQALHNGGIPYADALRMDPEHWGTLSKALGVKTPSKASIGETLFRLQRLEGAAQAAAGGVQ